MNARRRDRLHRGGVLLLGQGGWIEQGQEEEQQQDRPDGSEEAE
jgi:hypothetical protein